MSIRDVIMELIEAPDKDKEFIVECDIDTLKSLLNKENGWVQFDLKKIANCAWGSVAEIQLNETEDSNI